MTTFYYTYTLGFNKMLDIDKTPNKDGKYHCTLWCADNGEVCDSANLTVEEVREYLRNNNIDGTFEPRTETEF